MVNLWSVLDSIMRLQTKNGICWLMSQGGQRIKLLSMITHLIGKPSITPRRPNMPLLTFLSKLNFFWSLCRRALTRHHKSRLRAKKSKTWSNSNQLTNQLHFTHQICVQRKSPPQKLSSRSMSNKRCSSLSSLLLRHQIRGKPAVWVPLKRNKIRLMQPIKPLCNLRSLAWVR